jgi:protein PhnA
MTHTIIYATCQVPMENQTQCPQCHSENIYLDGALWVCPECSHEWNPADLAQTKKAAEEAGVIRDANGNVLQNGDSVTLIKELRIKGTSSAVKVGTKVKNIRLVDGGDGHDIACKIEGLGAINLKSEFVRKV